MALFNSFISILRRRTPHLYSSKTQKLAHLGLFQICLSETGEPPDWVQLVPAGKNIKARDGRKFSNAKPEDVVKAFEGSSLDLPIDFNHSSESRDERPAPAAGWIVELEIREGEIWGRVEWTRLGIEALRNKEYKYISPAFYQSKTGLVLELVSAGLTNRPALDLPSLASADNQNNGGSDRPMEQNMDLSKLLALLGLSADAKMEDILLAVATLKLEGEKSATKLDEVEKALAKAQTPSLDEFVPRADHDVVVARAETAEKQLAEQKEKAQNDKIEVVVAEAMKAGKVTPANKDFYVETCKQEGGLERFQAFVKNAPVVGPGDNTSKSLDKRSPPAGDKDRLTDRERKIIQECGISEEAFLKSRKERAAQLESDRIARMAS